MSAMQPVESWEMWRDSASELVRETRISARRRLLAELGGRAWLPRSGTRSTSSSAPCASAMSSRASGRRSRASRGRRRAAGECGCRSLIAVASLPERRGHHIVRRAAAAARAPRSRSPSPSAAACQSSARAPRSIRRRAACPLAEADGVGERVPPPIERPGRLDVGARGRAARRGAGVVAAGRPVQRRLGVCRPRTGARVGAGLDERRRSSAIAGSGPGQSVATCSSVRVCPGGADDPGGCELLLVPEQSSQSLNVATVDGGDRTTRRRLVAGSVSTSTDRRARSRRSSRACVVKHGTCHPAARVGELEPFVLDAQLVGDELLTGSLVARDDAG